jgi:hypothetical protein
MKKSKVTRSLLAACSIVALTAVMYGCVHDGGDDTPPPVVEPEPPTAYEAGKAAIMAAATAEAAQAAYDAVDQTAISGQEATSLKMALDSRLMALDTASRVAAQKMALSDAAGMIDTSDLSTQALVDAARTAIAGLRQAITDAADVSDADKAMYMTQLNDAVAAVDMAQGGIDTATRRTNQMAALSGASTTLQAALAALSGSTPTQAQLDAANSALSDLNAAITGGADLTEDEKAPYQREAANAAAPIETAQDAFDDAEDKADDAANAAMAVLASKLHTGIGAAPLDADRVIDISAAGVVSVTVPNGSTVDLAEDEKTMVADNHGWMGKKHTAEPTGDGMYEAVVYSNVEDPMPGKKFGGAAANDEFEYPLINGMVTVNTSDEAVQKRVASSSFDQTAGTKKFEKGSNEIAVMIAGSYHGVSGTYSCTPTGTAICASRVAADGFELGTVPSATDNTFSVSTNGWTFKPGNPNARVLSTDDNIYASYGWWLYTADDGDLIASAFAEDRGAVPDASGLDTLQGTATYKGGAAGKYALSSSIGGTNDAGDFTAKATLNADFTDNSITGTIDNFMGDDGMMRPWSVELKESMIGDGGILNTTGQADGAAAETVWTIGGNAADASGEWSGSLLDDGDDDVPQVATGTFYSEYGRAGRMVGAFGANKQ